MSTRERVAAALSTVPGVTGQPTPPAAATAGQGWPVWVTAAPDSYAGLRSTWHVLVALPNPDSISTIDAADPLVDQVWAALLDVGEVTAVDPVGLAVAEPAQSGQELPGLRFTLLTSGDRT